MEALSAACRLKNEGEGYENIPYSRGAAAVHQHVSAGGGKRPGRCRRSGCRGAGISAAAGAGGRAADAYPADARPLRPCGRSGGTAAENGCEGLAGPAGRVRRRAFSVHHAGQRLCGRRGDPRGHGSRVPRHRHARPQLRVRLPAVRRSAVQRRHAVRGGRGPYGPARRQLGHTAGKPEKAVRRSDGKRAGPARPRGVFHRANNRYLQF